VKKGLYRTWTEFEADVDLVWTNAMAFNEDGSQVYEDAKILKVRDLFFSMVDCRALLRRF
jgi:Bromodomain